MNRVMDTLRRRHGEHLEEFRAVCRIPSISTDPAHAGDVRRAIEWTRDLLQRSGLTARVAETGGHPVCCAEWLGAPGRPTYLVYGHMDVQPTGDVSLWQAAPFEPVERDGLLVCRGAADDKGQVLMHVWAAAAWLAAEQRLPVNLKFLIEGEEEIGSPHLVRFLQENAERLRCDHILISDTGMYEDGWPTITYGTRGLLYKEIRIHGPRHDLHSGGFGGTVANPANVLAALLASLHTADGRVNIPNFYDDVQPPSPAEAEQLRSLPLDDARYAADVGAPRVAGEAGFSTNERRWTRPTLDVNGIYGGFMGAGKNTIIPRSAGAKVSMRLVPNQSGRKLGYLFDRTVSERCPDTVRLEIIDHGAADAYLAPLDSRPMQAARRALRETYGREPALIREGGTLPILPMFKRVLGADSLMLGFAGPHCNAHGPNENIRLDELARGTESIARLYAALGE